MAPTADLKTAVDTSRLANKSMLVTGGASGLGSLIAAEAAKHGYGSSFIRQSLGIFTSLAVLVSQSRISKMNKEKSFKKN